MNARSNVVPLSPKQNPEEPMIRLFGVMQMAGVKLPTSPKIGGVFALLAWHAGRWVSLTKLVNELWEVPPKSASTTLQTYIYSLRKSLPKGMVTQIDSGYMLEVRPDDVDVLRFMHYVKKADEYRLTGHFEEALSSLGEGFSLIRGGFLDGLSLGAELSSLETTLQEEYQRGIQCRFEILFKRGEHAMILNEVRTAWRAERTNEDLAGMLMLALYRSRRNTDIYGIYQETKKVLFEEYGVNASKVLQSLYQRINQEDPALLKTEWTLNDL